MIQPLDELAPEGGQLSFICTNRHYTVIYSRYTVKKVAITYNCDIINYYH